MTRSSRARQWSLIAIALALLGLLGTTPSRSQQARQQIVRSEDAVVALFSLQTQLEVDNRMLRRLEARLEDNRLIRTEARGRVDKLYTELDELFARFRDLIHGKTDKDAPRAEGETVERLQALIEAKESDVMAAEQAETMLSDEGHRLRREIRGTKERMTLLSGQIDTLLGGLPPPRESVTGVWDVSLLPSGDKGVFTLFQSGTLVSGQYVLAGPFQGSLDGTLIDRKLLLHRIDSRLGRSMDFTATLSQDGQSLRGTWENYDLSNGQARTGAWGGRRRPPKSAEENDGREAGTPQE